MIVPLDGSRKRSEVGTQPGCGSVTSACRRRAPGHPAASHAFAARAGGCDGRQAGQGRRGLVRVGGEDDAYSPPQLLQLHPAGRVMLAQDGDEALPIGVPDQRAPLGRGSARRLAHAAGATITALP